jgi:hypothetical protein
MHTVGNGTRILPFPDIYILPRLANIFAFLLLLKNSEHSSPKTDSLSGFVAFIIYMITTFSLYVPDWSFVYHNDGDVNDGKQFTVSPRTCLGRS